jgi:ubiquinone/menaquinone biosynthesis C-methylase UbiE
LQQSQPQYDPVAPDWRNAALPETWADELDLRKPACLLTFIKSVFLGARQPVHLPDNMPGRDLIPKYILQEFHNLPNGNYSSKITRGYTRGFDVAMLGKMKSARSRLASWFKNLDSVLDAGCGGGQMAASLKNAGIPDVWGLDPSPYLLKHAAESHPGIHFVQGIAEDTGFRNERFGGVTACFLMHELPPRYADRALSEFNRILKPGGLLSICEPSSIQYQTDYLAMYKSYGLSGFYFKWLAHFVNEPFVTAWHKRDIPNWLATHGFELLKNDRSMPAHYLLARKKTV